MFFSNKNTENDEKVRKLAKMHYNAVLEEYLCKENINEQESRTMTDPLGIFAAYIKKVCCDVTLISKINIKSEKNQLFNIRVLVVHQYKEPISTYLKEYSLYLANDESTCGLLGIRLNSNVLNPTTAFEVGSWYYITSVKSFGSVGVGILTLTHESKITKIPNWYSGEEAPIFGCPRIVINSESRC